MAETIDNARLVVSLEARVRSYERALERAQKQTNARMAGIETALKRPQAQMNRLGNAAATFEKRFSRIGASLKGFGAGLFAGVSLQGAQTLIDSATRIQNALRVAGLEGAKLTETYEALFATAQRTGTPIEALVTLYSRLSVVQGELGVSSQQIIGFTDKIAVALQAGGTSATAAAGSLLQLTQALGSGVVRAEEFNSILEGTPIIAQSVAKGLTEAGGSVARLRALVNEGKVSSQAFFAAFEAGSAGLGDKVASSEKTISSAFVRLQNVLIDVAMRFEQSTGASKTLAEFLGGPLTTAIQELGGVLEGIAGPVSTFIDWMNQAVEAAIQGAADIGAALGTDQVGAAFGAKPYVGQRRIQSRIDSAFEGVAMPKRDRLEVDVNEAGSNETVSLADYPVSGAKSGSRSRAASEAERERKATADLIKELEEERRLIGAGALERARASAARRLGANATEAEKKQVDELVRSIAEEEAALARIAEQKEATAEATGFLLDSIGDGLGSIADGSVKASDALKKLAVDLGIAVAKAALLGQGPLAGLFGSGGGLLGSIFGGLGGGSIPAGVAGPWGASILHEGGTAGGPAPKRMVSPAMFAHAKRYHAGSLKPGELPAILEKTELVLDQMDARRTFETLGRVAAMGRETHNGGGRALVELRLSPDLEARILAEAGSQSVRIVKEYDKTTLPGSVARIRSDPYAR